MYTWLDGAYMRYLAIQQHQGMSNFFYSMNIFEGLGDISFPLLVNLIPATWFDLFLDPGLPYSVAVYTTLTAQYFIAAYLLCRIFHFSKKVSLSSAWLITVFVMPLLPTFPGVQPFHEITPISPYLINFIFFCTIFIYCFFYIGRTKLACTISLSFVAGLIVLYLVLSHAVGILIAVPFLVFLCSSFILIAEAKYELYSKIIFAISTLAILFLLNYFQFALGLFLYSIPAFYPSKLTTHFRLSSISILFESYYAFSQYISILGTAGLLINLLIGSRRVRKFSLIVFTYIFILVSFGSFVVMIPGWYHGPDPLYFEYLLWPLYMAYAVILVIYILEITQWIIQSVINSFRQYYNDYFLQRINNYFIAKAKTPSLFFLFILMIIAINFSFAKYEPKAVFAYSQTQQPLIIKYLIKNSAINQDGLFKGYTEAFYPKVDPEQFADWMSQITFDSLTLLTKIGYTYRMVGLWFYNIPTLNKYSPIISPALFTLVHNTLSRPMDHETRNVFLFTRINIPLLQALGVRFIIMNHKVNHPNMRYIVSEPIDKENGSLYLYEILKTNVVTFSPQNFVVLNDINSFLNQVDKQAIDFSRTVYVSSTVPYKLSKLKNASLYKIKDGVRLVADAQGNSTVLLPILYSHCLHVTFNDIKPEIFSLQRANLAETLLVFKKHIDVNIIYRYGLLNNADCRLKDRKELKNIIQS